MGHTNRVWQFNAIIRFSLQYRLLVVVVSATLLVYGSYLATTLPIDVFPDLDRPRVVIITECPGLATEEAETLVTQPIEVALLGAHGIQAVRSQTTAGLNVIYVEFDWNADVRMSRQIVQERLATLGGKLPDGIRPQMAPTASIMGQIVIAGMYRQRGPQGGKLAPLGDTDIVLELLETTEREWSLTAWTSIDRHRKSTWTEVPIEGLSWQNDNRLNQSQTAVVTIRGVTYEVTFPSDQQQRMALRTTADWVVRPRLLKISGIAEVFIQGGDKKQYQVLVDPAALIDFDVTLQEVEQAIEQSNINTSGGFAIQGETERPIRVLGRVGPEPEQVIDDLCQVPIKHNEGQPILLEDVARIVEGQELKRDGSIDGSPGVVFTLAKQPHIDTRALTEEISAKRATPKNRFPPTL